MDQVGRQPAEQGGEPVDGGEIGHRRRTPHHREHMRADAVQLEARQVPREPGIASQPVGHVDLPAGGLHPEGQFAQVTARPADRCLEHLEHTRHGPLLHGPGHRASARPGTLHQMQQFERFAETQQQRDRAARADGGHSADRQLRQIGDPVSR